MRALVVLVAEDGSVENRAARPAGGPAGLRADRGRQLPQRPHPRQDPRRPQGGGAGASRRDGEGPRRAHREARRGRTRDDRRLRRNPPAHRARPGEPARGPARGRGFRAHPPALLRSRDADRRHRASRPGGVRRRVDARPGWAGTPSDDPAAALDAYRDAGLGHLVARVVVVGDDPVASVHRVVRALAA